MTALAPIALRYVEGDGAERIANLVAQLAVVTPNADDDRTKHLDGLDGEVQDLETRDDRGPRPMPMPSADADADAERRRRAPTPRPDADADSEVVEINTSLTLLPLHG
jgi:hypothetical protein